jgi:hypothetical protein
MERQVIDLLGERFKLEPGTSESHDDKNSYIFMLANVCVHMAASDFTVPQGRVASHESAIVLPYTSIPNVNGARCH